MRKTRLVLFNKDGLGAKVFVNPVNKDELILQGALVNPSLHAVKGLSPEFWVLEENYIRRAIGQEVIDIEKKIKGQVVKHDSTISIPDEQFQYLYDLHEIEKIKNSRNFDELRKQKNILIGLFLLNIVLLSVSLSDKIAKLLGV